jgi:hypothetical protein
MDDDLERRHQQALARQRNSHELARSRAVETDKRRSDIKTEAQLGDLDAMRLKHDLDIENRGHDHQFNRAEDARELERLATETALRRRDDFIRKAWEDDQGNQELEGRILSKIADHKIATQQEDQRHSNLIAEKTDDHLNAKEMAVLTNELDKDNFNFKERLRLQLSREGGALSMEEIADAMRTLDGKN